MQTRQWKAWLVTLAAAAATLSAAGNAAPPMQSEWQVVVNNGFEIPGHPGRFYNSYNPPSVNAQALVVFRARSTGRQQGPVSGIYSRRMDTAGNAVHRIGDRVAQVPEPNNTYYPAPGGPGNEALATFNEFPSFPRIAIGSNALATRGNHPPVWTYIIGTDPVTGEPIETRAGTTGVYVNLRGEDPLTSPLVTGASLLGEVGNGPHSDFTYLFSVPGEAPGTRFEVFPGSPAVTDEGNIAFKGNYSVPDPASADPDATIGKTGVFYRRVVADYAGGMQPIGLIANTDTPVPNPGACAAGTTFGSTAPPSAAGRHIVFVGWDNEAAPTCGGIYRARFFAKRPRLQTLVGLETLVPGQGGASFSSIGEGLSFDGRFVGFWGAWGEETRTLRLYCPQEGNRVRRDFCNNVGDFAPDPATGEIRGDPISVCDDQSDPRWPVCYQEKPVPVNQGVFVYDIRTDRLQLIAQTGVVDAFDDFKYWHYSGAPPGAGHGHGNAEPPRFRSAAFLSVYRRAGATFRVAFLARNGEMDPDTNAYGDVTDGIYLAESVGSSPIEVTPLIVTGMDGTALDPAATWDDDENPATPDVPLVIASVALEREALRGKWLAITASMGSEDAGWAGIYLTDLQTPPRN
jgi:hypothetical protein